MLPRWVKVYPKMPKLKNWHFNTGLKQLDLGDGKKVDLNECSRSKLQKQSIKYLGPQEREHYEYIVAEGRIVHAKTGNLLDTTKGLPRAKWIFVMSTSKRLYAGEKKKGMFHHSSFLAGGATSAAGRLVVEDGRVISISAYSGHYRPTEDRLDSFLSFLNENGVNLDEVEIGKANEAYESYDDGMSIESGSASEFSALSNSPSQADFLKEGEESLLLVSDGNLVAQTSRYNRSLSGGLHIPIADVPKTAILRRIHSEKSTKSYQLGHQLSMAWSTGAGPRIGCVADFPAELRWQALELTNLSPRPCSV
ncbi:IQ domain-containing protein IQM3-like isoform X2 [Nicotiana tomentosiformis]|uniref:IQ domain-containing protein IQM3-like isoform X2 n=1 Tax=Nicotiana tomentosiformis TaxID=4098 RepID=UPI00388C7F07